MGLYDTTLGTLLVGILFNTFLYGLVTYQFAAYYRTAFNDPPIIKCMVLFLFVLDTFHSSSAIYMVWSYTVTNYDNPAALEIPVWPYPFTPAGTALAALSTQLFLGFRIWCMTDSKILYGVVILLAIFSFIFGMICSIEAWVIKILSELPSITPIVIVWLTTQVVVDTFITTTLVIIFARSRTGSHRTDTVLNRLIRGAIQTGLFAGIFSLGDLISFIVVPSTNLYGMFAIPIGRVYTNTLLDSLLSRRSLRTELYATYDKKEVLSSVLWGAMDSQASSEAQSAGDQHRVQKTTQQMRGKSARENTPSMIIPLPV